MTPDRSLRTLVATTLAAVALTGCAYGQAEAAQSAGASADAAAELVGQRLARWGYGDHTAMEFAHVALTTELHGDRIEVLEARGDAHDDNGVLVVRLTTPLPDGYGGEPTQTDGAIPRCYRYDVTISHRSDKPHRVDPCPDLPALTVPEPPPPPQLPTESWDRAKAALTKLTRAERKDLKTVEAAVLLSIAGARGPHLDTAVEGTAIGVAVRAGDDCLLVRVDGAKVAVWAPPSVYLLPGEAGCTAALAASGHTSDPH